MNRNTDGNGTGPRHYGQTYVGGGSHRPIPLATDPPRARPPAAPSSTPATWVQQALNLLVATEGHPDATVRTARKTVANALVDLNHAARAANRPKPTPAAPRRKTRQSLTDDQIAEVCRRYTAGESTTRLGAAFGVSAPTIGNRLREAGIPLRPKGGRHS